MSIEIEEKSDSRKLSYDGVNQESPESNRGNSGSEGLSNQARRVPSSLPEELIDDVINQFINPDVLEGYHPLVGDSGPSHFD